MITTSKDEGVCVVKINRPTKLNAMNIDVAREIISTFEQLDKDDSVKVIVLTGEGDKAFSAGADIEYMSKISADESEVYAKLGQEVTATVENVSKPTIAAVNGFALGGGCEVAMACHIRFCSENAIIGQPESGLGLIPGFGGTQRLPRIVGSTHAYNLLLSGDSISAKEAKSIGFVSDVFKSKELLGKCIDFAKKINKKSPFSSSLIIELVNKGSHLSLEDALSLESDYFKKVFDHENRDIGIDAFLNKNNPDFKD